MRLLVTRPEPDATAQARLLSDRGHEAIPAPLFEVEFIENAHLPDEQFQAVIATSRNALRAMERLPDFKGLLDHPLFAVGAATARLAAQIGFTDVREGGGTAERLVPEIRAQCSPGNGPLLHPAGEKLAWDLKGVLETAGFAVLQPVVYRARAVPRLPGEAVEALKSGLLDGVILMSPEAARHFVGLVKAHALESMVAKPALFCLSKAVEKALADLPNLRTRVAGAPTQDDLLALIGPDAAN